MPDQPQHRRRWRDYRTTNGNRPVKEFLDSLPDADRIEIIAAMHDVATNGLDVARHLQGHDNLWEVRATGQHRIYRVIFSPEGRDGQVLLALHAFNKKTQRTPPDVLRLAAERLADWRRRGVQQGPTQRSSKRHGRLVPGLIPRMLSGRPLSRRMWHE